MYILFAEGNIECVEKLLKPAKRVLKVGMPIKHDAFERRVELWNKIRMNYDSYLDEECGSFLKDLDQHFCSLFDGALLVLASSFRENGEFFGAANIFSDEEVKLFRNIERYNLFEILSVDDIRKKLIQKDDKVIDLLRDYYVSMDSWVDEQLENPNLRLTLRYYLKKKWDGYKGKLNQAVSSSVVELDWLKTLIDSWDHKAKTDLIAQEEADRRKKEQERQKQEELRRQREEEEREKKEKEALERKQQEEKERKRREEEEKVRKEKEEQDRLRKQAEEAFAEGKGSRYVKLEEAKQYELNFIGRLGHRLGDRVIFSGKTYRVENLKEIKQKDTSSLEISGLSERDLKNLPENRLLIGNLTEKTLFWKKQRYYLKALYFARVEKYAKAGYDTDPLELKDFNACLAKTWDEAKEKREWILFCLASPTGFEDAIGRHISSEDFHKNFLSKYLSVCLLDLETGKQLYNPNDEVAKEFAKLCELETESEKDAKLKLSVRKAIEDGLLLKDFVVLGDISKILGNDAAVKSAFYEYAEEKGYNIRFVKDIGLLMMK